MSVFMNWFSFYTQVQYMHCNQRMHLLERWTFIPCYRKYSQSEYREAFVYLTAFLSALWLCRIDSVVHCIFYGLVKYHGITPLSCDCIFLVWAQTFRWGCILRKYEWLMGLIPWYTTGKHYSWYKSTDSTVKTSRLKTGKYTVHGNEVAGPQVPCKHKVEQGIFLSMQNYVYSHANGAFISLKEMQVLITRKRNKLQGFSLWIYSTYSQLYYL